MIVLLTEGDTERALREHLKEFLDRRAAQERKSKVRLVTRGRIEVRADKLLRQVELELENAEV